MNISKEYVEILNKNVTKVYIVTKDELEAMQKQQKQIKTEILEDCVPAIFQPWIRSRNHVL